MSHLKKPKIGPLRSPVAQKALKSGGPSFGALINKFRGIQNGKVHPGAIRSILATAILNWSKIQIEFKLHSQKKLTKTDKL